MKYRIPLTIIVVLFSLSFSFGQLSGYYTVGNSESDYQTLNEALTDLYDQGIASNVTFALQPGTYSGITFSEIPGTSETSRLTLQSIFLDSTEVTFNGTIKFNEASNISIRAVTIETPYSRAIECIRSVDIQVRNCQIISNYEPDYDDATIHIKQFWADQGGWSDFTLDNCKVDSESPGVYCVGDSGELLISNSTVTTPEDLSIYGKWTKKVNIHFNHLTGGIDAEAYDDSRLIGNVISGKVHFGYLDSVINNIITSEETVRMSAGYYKGNHFSCPRLSNGNPGYNSYTTYINNIFDCGFRNSRATDVKFIGNIFHAEVFLSFNNELLFTNNQVYGIFGYGDTGSDNWNYRIHNNIFFNEYVQAGGHHSIISYNNFVDSAFLYLNYADAIVSDNNFCRGIEGPGNPDNITNNNFTTLFYNPYDTSSVQYDPGYNENNPGITTNPLLQGKGKSDPPEYDILGNRRRIPAAIGANEILICSDSANINISVPCGEELYLNMCNLPDTGNFWWTPDLCISNPDTCYTSVTACADMTLFLHNSVYGIIDSVSVNTFPFEAEIAEMPLFYCGYARTVNATYHHNASYHWTPEEYFNDPNVRSPKLLIEDTTNLQFVMECQIDGCGTTYDTLNVEFDPLPNVTMIYPEQVRDTVFFTCISTCVDKYLWDFGDGTYSTEENPYHIFPGNGYYTITLTGTNHFGSRSHTADYYYYWVRTDKEMWFEEIKVFPNPAKHTVFIKGLPAGEESSIRLTDIKGRLIKNINCVSNKTNLNIDGLQQGIYFLQLRIGSNVLTKKIIITN